MAAFVGFHVVALGQGLFHPSFALIRVTYNAATFWFPSVLLGAAAAGWLLQRRPILRGAARRHIRAWFILGLLLASARLYATHIEPRLLQVRRVTLHSAKFDRPLRILHISDIQSERVGRYEAACFRAMREIKPDLVVHSGDLVHPIRPATFGSEWPKLRALFHTLSPPLGIYGVYGDTDERVHHLTLSQVPRDWARGFRETGRTRLNVSAGIGCEHASELPRIRLNCPPEMTLIEILP